MTLNRERRNALEIAKDLGYEPKVLDAIRGAHSEIEIQNILKNAREKIEIKKPKRTTSSGYRKEYEVDKIED